MELEKDFDGWNIIKKKIDSSRCNLFFSEKEIWWCFVGMNIGAEHCGKGRFFKRPVYVLKKINSKTFVGVPLTSKLREDSVHVSFYFNDDFSTAKISQIKVFSKDRLSSLIGVTSNYLQNKIKKATVALIVS